MSDIVERIRGLRYVHVPVASALFEEACQEIERLRQDLSQKNLTDEERAAVAYFAAFHQSPREADANAAATLRGLLERTK